MLRAVTRGPAIGAGPRGRRIPAPGGGETTFSYGAGVKRLLIGLAAAAALAGCGGGGESSEDRTRADALTSFLEDSGLDKHFSVEDVQVDGGNVTIETSIEPKVANEADLIAPCQALVGIEPWIESVTVEANDGESHVFWDRERSGCDTRGLG